MVVPKTPPRSRPADLVHSVFFRMVVSYVLLVFIVAVSVASVSSLFFQARYNAELENVHRSSLKSIAEELTSRVVDRSKAIYMEVAGQLNSPNSTVVGPDDGPTVYPVKVLATFRYLQELVARNFETVEAVHLYYPAQGLIVSSSGMTLTPSFSGRMDGRTWAQTLVSRGRNCWWTELPPDPITGITPQRRFTVLRSFPILDPPGSAQVIVAIDFGTDLAARILDRLGPIDGSTLSLRDQDGRTVLASQDSPGEKGQGRLTTSEPLADTGWTLVSDTPLVRLYEKSDSLRWVLGLICLGSIVLGVAVALVLTSRIYNPLDRLTARVRRLFGRVLPPLEAGPDEYRLLDTAIEGLSNKMDELAATLDQNRPIMRQELVQRLLDGDLATEEEAGEAAALVGLPPFPARMAALVLDLGPGPGAPPGGREGLRLTKYRVAAAVEDRFTRYLLWAALPGHRLGLVTEVPPLPEALEADLQALSRDLEPLFPVRLGWSVGRTVGSAADLGASFQEAQAQADYRFFFPETAVLFQRADLLAREGRRDDPGKVWREGLADSLRRRSPTAFGDHLDRLRDFCRAGRASAAACRQELDLLVRTVEAGAGFPPLNGWLDGAGDLEAFLDEVRTLATQAFTRPQGQTDQRNALLVGRIRDHIADHLGSDLSLDRVGEAMAISPGYMSRIFRQETGQSFVEYVTEARLAAAETLLRQTRQPVQDIGAAVGFHTPAYFIRQFKAKHGKTPVDYRREA